MRGVAAALLALGLGCAQAGDIYWYYNPQGQPTGLTEEVAVAAIQRGLSSWMACGLEVRYGGLSTADPVNGDGQFTVGWHSRVRPSVRIGAGPFPSLGRTTQLWNLNTRRPLESDIILNADRLTGQPPDLLTAVAAHEMGHVLGLDHVFDASSIMDYRGVRPQRQAPSFQDVYLCRWLVPGG